MWEKLNSGERGEWRNRRKEVYETNRGIIRERGERDTWINKKASER